VTANITGNNNYTTKEVTKSFTVNQKAPEMTIDVPDHVAPGSQTYIVVNIGDNATGKANIYIDGVPNEVNVINGVAKLAIDTNKTGTFNVTARYFGDTNYTGGENTTGKLFTVDRFNVDMNFTVEVDDSNNATFVIQFNETDVGGNVTINVNGHDYTVDVVNGVARVNVDVLTKENNPNAFTAVYSGDDRYNARDLSVNATVGKLNNGTMNVTIVPSPAEFGDPVKVIIDAPGITNGTITVNVNGTDYPAVKQPDGTYVAEIPDKPVGIYDVNITCVGDANYNDFNDSSSYDVKANSSYSFNVTVSPDDIGYGDEVTITVNAPAGVREVNVTIDEDTTVVVPIDPTTGTGQYKLSNLSAGTHVVTASFTGNENYTKASNSTSFTIAKITPSIDIEVTPSVGEAGGSVDINVTLPVNATGWVNIIVDGKDNMVELEAGKAGITVDNLRPNGHNITVKYINGDVNYTAAEKNATFNVTKFAGEPVLEGIVSDENNNVTVIVKVPEGATGNVTVTIDGKNYTANVTDGIAMVNIGNQTKGDKEINITYSGDENYNPKTITESVTVPALRNYTLPVVADSISYGEDAIINVTLPDGAHVENLTVFVGDKQITDYTVIGNVVQYNVTGLGAGNHTVTVSYAEDETYADLTNTTVFNVAKVEPQTKEINVTSPIDVGQVANVTVKLPTDANGTITVEVNGTKYVADVVNGEANISIPKLGNGTHEVIVTYSGDDNYDPITVTETLVVSKVDPQITANTTDIILGENAKVIVTLPDDATETVTIRVAGIEYTTGVHGGVNEIIVEGVPVGTHAVEVTYSGDNKYETDVTSTQITVSPKPTKEDDIKIIDNGDGTITVIVPDNATGNITVKIGDEVLPAVNLTDGKAVINLTNSSQKPGKYNLTVTYSGDENHTGITVNSTGVIPKWDSSINATAPKLIRQGDDAVITVEVTPGDARGNIRVDVNGKGYYAMIDDTGKATITVPGLKNGTYDVLITYDGDDNYNGNTTAAQIVVEPPIVIDINGTGNSSEVVINLPENDTSKYNLTVLLDNQNASYTVNNGTVKVNLTGVLPGAHNITVIYTDEYGTESVVNKTVTVPRWDSSVSATAATIREGDDASIIVTVGGKDMQGLVRVDIDGTGYYANMTDGVIVIDAPGLKSGTYYANVTYDGSWKYDSSNNTFMLIVEAPIVINIDGTGDNTKIVVDLPANGTDNVTIYVDGKPVPRTIVDGQAIADISDLPLGEHNVTVVYTDKDGTQSVVSKIIKKFRSINANDMTRGLASPFDYEAEFLDSDGHVLVNTNVNYVINGVTYTATTDNKGIAKLTTSHLPLGTYDVKIINPVTKEEVSKKLTIVPRLVENKDVTMDFNDGHYYVVRAIGDNGQPVGAGEIVRISVNGVHYAIITDNQGYAKLKLTLNPKKYKITAQYAAFEVSNTLKIKQTLKLVKKTVKVKKTAKKLVIKAKLKWSNGKAIKGKKLVLKFKGKKYKAKTNKKGIAKFTIKKKVLKKLKKGKKYKYSVTYIKNTVKGKVKVKK
jgi:hypothetical protein